MLLGDSGVGSQTSGVDLSPFGVDSTFQELFIIHRFKTQLSILRLWTHGSWLS